MKRILCSCLSVLLLLATVLTFAACGEQKTQSQLVMDAVENTFTAKGSEAAAVSDMMNRVVQGGSVSVAIDGTPLGNVLGKLYFEKNHTVLSLAAGEGDSAVTGTIHMTDKELVALCDQLREGAFGIRFEQMKDLLPSGDSGSINIVPDSITEMLDVYARIGAERDKALESVKKALVKALEDNAEISKKTENGTDVYTYTLDAEKVIALLDALVEKIKADEDVKAFYADYAKAYNTVRKWLASGNTPEPSPSDSVSSLPVVEMEELPATLDELLSEENLAEMKAEIRKEMEGMALIVTFSVKKETLVGITVSTKKGEETSLDLSLKIDSTADKKEYTLVFKGEFQNQKGTFTVQVQTEKTATGSTLSVKVSADIDSLMGQGLSANINLLSLTATYNKADGAFSLNGTASVGSLSVEGTYKRTENSLTLGLSKAEITPSSLMQEEKKALPYAVTVTFQLGDSVPALPEYDNFTTLPQDEQLELMMKLQQMMQGLFPQFPPQGGGDNWVKPAR